MKKALKRILLASTVMVTALAAGIFTSCARGSLEDQKRKEGYIYTVTYDANGGKFGSTITRTYALVKENSPTLAPGYVDEKTQASIKVPERIDYELVGEAADNGNDNKNEEAILSKSWFLAETDDNGNIRYDSEGEPITSNTPWNFATDRVTGDITLVAKWTQVFRFSICIVDVDANNNRVEKEIGSAKAKVGDTIYDKLFTAEKDGSIIRRPDKIRIKQSGYTLLDFYMDEAYQNLLETGYTHPGMQVIGTETDTETNETVEIKTNTVKIYAKYLKGTYDFITNANKKSLTRTSNWYLLEDVDYTGEKQWNALTNFTGKIMGNGYSIKNVTVKSTATDAKVDETKLHSIFGKMSGSIENLTFENVTMRVEAAESLTSVSGKQGVTFFASEFAQAGLISNVTLQDCKIVVKVATAGDGKVFEYATGEFGGLWWTLPADEQATVVVKENDQIVTAIKVVEE